MSLTETKSSTKALFTLAFLVSHELKSLITKPEVKEHIDQDRFSKFKHYFNEAYGTLTHNESNINGK